MFEKEHSIPLPPFLMEFLKKKNVQFKPNPELINIPPPIEGTFESTIQSLTQARTPHSILSQYIEIILFKYSCLSFPGIN